MPQITWRDVDGALIEAEVPVGKTLMEAAVAAGVQGIYGDCGGALACATCHVIPDDDWADRVGKPDTMEHEMLDMVEGIRAPNSRLSCQIRSRDDLDGLILNVPGTT